MSACLQLGAVCAGATGPAVTHVVAAQPNTDKALWARSCGKHIVSPAWLLESGMSFPVSMAVASCRDGGGTWLSLECIASGAPLLCMASGQCR
jgi:twin BRCT domain